MLNNIIPALYSTKKITMNLGITHLWVAVVALNPLSKGYFKFKPTILSGVG